MWPSDLEMMNMVKQIIQNHSKQELLMVSHLDVRPNPPLIFISTEMSTFDVASDDTDRFDGYHTIRAVGYSRSNSLFIIVAACVIGGIVIVINIIVITYIIRKKQTHGGSVPVIPLSKPHHIPVEKTYQGGSKYDSQYCCDDPNHRHAYGDHFYMPDPLLVGETAQLNPVYGYVPIGDTPSDGICQSAYVPTLYTSDPNYQQVHQTLLPEFQSPLTPVVS